MRESIRQVARKSLVGLPVLAAVLVVAYLVTHRAGPTKKNQEETARALRVIKTPIVEPVPRATGYGVAQPGQVWEAVSEVKGTILSVHPSLNAGELIDENEILLRLDPSEYELAVARLEAGIEESRAKIEELSAEAENKKQS